MRPGWAGRPCGIMTILMPRRLSLMLGVLIGSLMGTRVLVKTQTKLLRLVFSAVIVLLGLEMVFKGLRGGF